MRRHLGLRDGCVYGGRGTDAVELWTRQRTFSEVPFYFRLLLRPKHNHRGRLLRGIVDEGGWRVGAGVARRELDLGCDAAPYPWHWRWTALGNEIRADVGRLRLLMSVEDKECIGPGDPIAVFGSGPKLRPRW
jgi:hypothetical protein